MVFTSALIISAAAGAGCSTAQTHKAPEQAAGQAPETSPACCAKQADASAPPVEYSPACCAQQPGVAPPVEYSPECCAQQPGVVGDSTNQGGVSNETAPDAGLGASSSGRSY